jgi:hypothetical protein
MSPIIEERRRLPWLILSSLGAFAGAIVVGWFVVSQLAIWFGYEGLLLAGLGLVGLAGLVWTRTRLGPAWALGSAAGGLPTLVFYLLFLG